MEEGAEALKAHAARARRLAAITLDVTVASALRIYAEECESKAEALEHADETGEGGA